MKLCSVFVLFSKTKLIVCSAIVYTSSKLFQITALLYSNDHFKNYSGKFPALKKHVSVEI